VTKRALASARDKARSGNIFLHPSLSFLPRPQVRPIAFDCIVVQVKDARVARPLAAIFAAGTHGRHGPRVVLLE
jgi:hypothetical protein